MKLNELKMPGANFSQSTVAYVLEKDQIIFSQREQWIAGSCDTVRWDRLHQISDQIIGFASKVLNISSGRFIQTPGYVPLENGFHTRFGVHIELADITAEHCGLMKQLIPVFLMGITSEDQLTGDFFDQSDIQHDLRDIVKDQIQCALANIGGFKLPKPLAVEIAGNSFVLSGKFPNPLEKLLDTDQFVIEGVIEGFSRPDRQFQMISLESGKEILKTINYSVNKFFQTIKRITCDDQTYVVTVHRERTDKSKVLIVVDKIATLDGEDIVN